MNEAVAHAPGQLLRAGLGVGEVSGFSWSRSDSVRLTFPYVAVSARVDHKMEAPIVLLDAASCLDLFRDSSRMRS